jgi:hypothetical protein
MPVIPLKDFLTVIGVPNSLMNVMDVMSVVYMVTVTDGYISGVHNDLEDIPGVHDVKQEYFISMEGFKAACLSCFPKPRSGPGHNSGSAKKNPDPDPQHCVMRHISRGGGGGVFIVKNLKWVQKGRQN